MISKSIANSPMLHGHALEYSILKENNILIHPKSHLVKIEMHVTLSEFF